MKKKILIALLASAGVALCMPGADTARATIFLNDGKLEISGYLKEQIAKAAATFAGPPTTEHFEVSVQA